MKEILSLQRLVKTAVLLALALTVQLLHLPTYLTGPLINAILIAGVVLITLPNAIMVALLTPWGALLLGIIPPVVAPMVPIIMLANVIYVSVFKGFQKKNIYISVILASVCKYLIFFVGIKALLSLFELVFPGPVLAAFQIPQLITALVGGFLAIFLTKIMLNKK